MVKKFYVCSYGGSGSKMLCKALQKYGTTYHIHSRYPPDKLEYIGTENGGNTYYEWFNGITIPENKLSDYYVIYIYRNPSYALQQRGANPNHLKHIQAPNDSNLDNILNTGKDLVKIKEFYNNYTRVNQKRNYKIFCVKYEDIFCKQDELSNLLGIGKLNLVNKSTSKSHEKLDIIYSDLIKEMEDNNFIMIR